MSLSPRICAAIGRENSKDALAVAKSVSSQADVIEIRLDTLQDPAIDPFVECIDIPLLFTNRPTWEGGNFAGAEEERLQLLLDAVEKEVAYVDLELRAPAESRQHMHSALRSSKTKLIHSYHNFTETPGNKELVACMEMMQENGADIGKIITTAHDYKDVLQVLQLQEVASRVHFPLIAFCMGEPGVMSRVATCALGGYMTYCAVSESELTAPGQLTVATLREIYTLLAGKKK